MGYEGGVEWRARHEVFCVCRACRLSSIYLIILNDYEARSFFYDDGLVDFKHAINDYFDIIRHISVRDKVGVPPPKYLPKDILNAFSEGVTCCSTGCYNASAAMFRLCVDLATKSFLPPRDAQGSEQPNEKTRRDLGLRLPWLFERNILPRNLEALAKCIKEDGNDGAHAGNILEVDALDLQDFTTVLLERLYTEPQELLEAERRRLERRGKPA